MLNYNENFKTYYCRKIRLCNYLLNKGFDFTGIAVDIKEPTRKVWLFDETKELVDAINQYYVEGEKLGFIINK